MLFSQNNYFALGMCINLGITKTNICILLIVITLYKLHIYEYYYRRNFLNLYMYSCKK